jgi:hypothetical protein
VAIGSIAWMFDNSESGALLLGLVLLLSSTAVVVQKGAIGALLGLAAVNRWSRSEGSSSSAGAPSGRCSGVEHLEQSLHPRREQPPRPIDRADRIELLWRS